MARRSLCGDNPTGQRQRLQQSLPLLSLPCLKVKQCRFLRTLHTAQRMLKSLWCSNGNPNLAPPTRRRRRHEHARARPRSRRTSAPLSVVRCPAADAPRRRHGPPPPQARRAASARLRWRRPAGGGRGGPQPGHCCPAGRSRRPASPRGRTAGRAGMRVCTLPSRFFFHVYERNTINLTLRN